MAALLEPAVEVEHPVDRLHPVVREEEDCRLLAVLRLGRLDQLAAERVDALVDPQELVARACRGVRRVLGVEAGVAEVADVVGAHEVDREQPEVGLHLETELAHAGHLLGHDFVEGFMPPVGHSPAAVFEAAGGVLLRSAGRLHDAIEGDE